MGDEPDGEGGGVQVRIDLLGPLHLVVEGTPVEVPGPRRRAVLALLAMAGGRVVSTDRLLDALWPAEPPDSGRRTLHSHISRLRGHLGPAAGRLVRDGNGYRLDLRAGELDVAEARTAEGPAAALALWRGVALDEFADVAPLAADAAALAELRRPDRRLAGTAARRSWPRAPRTTASWWSTPRRRQPRSHCATAPTRCWSGRSPPPGARPRPCEPPTISGAGSRTRPGSTPAPTSKRPSRRLRWAC